MLEPLNGAKLSFESQGGLHPRAGLGGEHLEGNQLAGRLVSSLVDPARSTLTEQLEEPEVCHGRWLHQELGRHGGALAATADRF
jgi:hypothetical protein